MNLYKIQFSHHAPKGMELGIKALLLAENDEQVYEWIKSDPKTNERINSGWSDKEDSDGDEEDSDYENEDEEGNVETFKNRMLRLKGDMDDDSVDFSDSYYGITLFGWELLKEDVKTDYTELIELGIMFKI